MKNDFSHTDQLVGFHGTLKHFICFQHSIPGTVLLRSKLNLGQKRVALNREPFKTRPVHS